MTAIWSVDTEAFYNNAKKVKNQQPIMAVVKNNAYHYGLEFAVKQFYVQVFIHLVRRHLKKRFVYVN